MSRFSIIMYMRSLTAPVSRSSTASCQSRQRSSDLDWLSNIKEGVECLHSDSFFFCFVQGCAMNSTDLQHTPTQGYLRYICSYPLTTYNKSAYRMPEGNELFLILCHHVAFELIAVMQIIGYLVDMPAGSTR